MKREFVDRAIEAVKSWNKVKGDKSKEEAVLTDLAECNLAVIGILLDTVTIEAIEAKFSSSHEISS